MRKLNLSNKRVPQTDTQRKHRPKAGRKGHRIDANYTEEVVGFALESFLTQISFPRQRFSIEPFSKAEERRFGADARLDGNIRGFRPFYMQFKRPAAYPDYSRSKIITDRVRLDLETQQRILYFPLREKKASHPDYQHNVLYKLRQHLLTNKTGDAAYVCPLFVDRSAYRLNLHLSGLRRWPFFWREIPWELEDILLHDRNGPIHFDRIPVLAEHITVPPHDLVTSAKHRYSFTENGTDLCFHSPKALPDGSSNLAKFLSRVSDAFLRRGQKITHDRASSVLADLIQAVYGDQKFDETSIHVDKLDPIGQWLVWGDHLRTEYAIEQYAFVSWRE